jgi:hypothetical protein
MRMSHEAIAVEEALPFGIRAPVGYRLPGAFEHFAQGA